jgi:hypothetical protein
MRAQSTLLLPVAAVFAVACGGALAELGTIDNTIGRASLHDIMTDIPDLLHKRGYAIYQTQSTGSTLYIETGWQERAPFDDEAKQRVDGARTRFIVRGRRTGPGMYQLVITAENQVKASDDSTLKGAIQVAGGWSTMRPTEMYRAYVRDITGEIKMKVDAGIRTYDVLRDGAAPLTAPSNAPPSRARTGSAGARPAASESTSPAGAPDTQR